MRTMDVTVETDESVPAGECAVPAGRLEEFDADLGHQVRLRTGGTSALFTVVASNRSNVAIAPGDRDRVVVDRERFDATVDARVPHPTYDRATAEAESEFVERAVARSSDLVACAPHGGYIEYGTDEQAALLSEWLDATLWSCAGWNDGGGAYRRWHVSSADIHPASFPELAALADVGFEHAVSFHGWGESHVAVGGAAPKALRRSVRESILDAVDGELDVVLGADDARDGSSPNNFVNWLTADGAGGIQLEQSYEARTEYGEEIVMGVADVLVDH